MTHRGFALFFALIFLACGTAFAQSKTDADLLYGQGVHAFNSRQYAEAIGFFDQIEALDAQDPRAYFFRGLAHARSGNDMAANADYVTASKMELTVAGRSYSVPKALERIQGRERMTIEQHRRAARRAWDAEQNLRRQDEFLAQKAENQKLYQTIIASGESAVEPPPAPDVSDLSLPFGARPVTPFAESKPAAQLKAVSGASGNGLSDDNIFKEQVERVNLPKEPEPKPTAPPKPQDPAETGIFDYSDTDDVVEGFDTGALLQGVDSAKPRAGSGFGGFGFGAGDDNGDFDTPISSGDFGGGDDNAMIMPGGGGMNFGPGNISTGPSESSAKESGRSFGKGFAGFFKKSGGETPSAQPGVSPSNQGETATDAQPDGDEEADPFGDGFEF